VSNLKWLKEYSGQTVDELLALERDYRVDSLVTAFHQAIDQKIARDGEGSLSAEETLVIAIEALEMEVNNGGYALFFTGWSKQYAPGIVAALTRIRCPQTATITQKAIDALKLTALTVEAIDAAMTAEDKDRDRILDECDQRYYRSGEDIAKSLFAFIRSNRDAIRL
jgi:hypothetical protein